MLSRAGDDVAARDPVTFCATFWRNLNGVREELWLRFTSNTRSGGNGGHADDISTVGTVVGDVFYRAPNENPTFTGELIGIGNFGDGSVGSYTLGPGETNSVIGGSNVSSFDSPFVIVAEGQGSSGAFTIEGSGSGFSMVGNGAGTTLAVGRDGAVGTLNVLNGALLELNDPSNISEFLDPNFPSSASIQLCLQGGTGTFNLNNATTNISSTLDAFLFLGSAQMGSPLTGGTSFTNITNGGQLNITALAPLSSAPGIQSEAGIVLNQDELTQSFMTIDASSAAVTGEAGYAGMSIAREQGSSGTFNLQNGSTLTFGANTLGVANDQYTGAFLTIGSAGGSNGTMTVGSASSMTMTSGLDGAYIGLGRDEGALGRLTVEGGGSITYENPADDGFIEIGQNDPDAANGGVGIMTVTGIGSEVVFDGEVSVGNSMGTGSSTGLLTVADGGRLETRTINLWDGGFLLGNGGTIEADVFAHAGSFIAPGASPGIMTIDGNLSLLAGSTLKLEFAGSQAGDFDVLNVLGDLFADGPFNIVFSFLDGYEPGEAETFDFLNVGGSFQSDFFDLAQISFLGLQNTSASLAIGPNGTLSAIFVEVAPIPLPATVWMLFAGVGALGFVRRKRLLS